uniref:Uncharacterized protein n=1 Tax=Anguilla anguilla TaxID=7936 RepID=A0A0E9XYK7_ANGAN
MGHFTDTSQIFTYTTQSKTHIHKQNTHTFLL